MFFKTLDGRGALIALYEGCCPGSCDVSIDKEEYISLGGVPKEPAPESALNAELRLLRSQNQALGSQNDFMEECLVEMATLLYK